MIPGSPHALGATLRDGGVNFALYSSVATRVELCLYNADGSLQGNVDLPDCNDGIWHGFMPNVGAGQLYGYRVHGAADSHAQEASEDPPSLQPNGTGSRFCNPSKLLIDPYAKQLHGPMAWHQAVLGTSNLDSAPYVPKSVVSPPLADAKRRSPVAMADSVMYEANVRGLTMNHPHVSPDDRGRFDGMRSHQILEHLKAMGITAIELMPIHAFVDEHHLYEKDLRNFWGYNTLNFFAPMSRYARFDPVAECRAMVDAFHDAGIEVIMDVVYNHTAEGDHNGPTLSFRGIDNDAYYRMTEDGAHYINDTGCGNTLNCDQPMVQQLILDSLAYWVNAMGVDGFRFDLAPVLGRFAHGFSSVHPLLEKIAAHPDLQGTKLIAEPWDTGPGGYQLGQFPLRWAEWNDRYRDTIRSFWRQDPHVSGELAQGLRGSSAWFERNGRTPSASLNFVTSHDGFTLNDVASYLNKHNDANGENNRDGHGHNLSINFGTEGPTESIRVKRARRRHRLNLLATLLISQGTPMLLAGDEMGNSQGGNNNAYAQDNETGWVDWSGLESDGAFTDSVKQLIALRRAHPLLRLDQYVHDVAQIDGHDVQVFWLNANGRVRFGGDWQSDASFTLVLHQSYQGVLHQQIAVVFNIANERRSFKLDSLPSGMSWELVFASSHETCEVIKDGVSVPENSMAIVFGTRQEAPAV